MEPCLSSFPIQCEVSQILERLEPIHYEDGILVVSAPVSVGSSAILLGDQTIGVQNNVLNFPDNSTIDQEPLKDPPFTGDILELPPETVIDNAIIFTTNYFYFMNNSSTNSGNYMLLNELFGYSGGGRFPFIAPKDCVLTSLIFSFLGNTEASTVSITNATAHIDIISTSGVITQSVVTATIPVCPPNKKLYVDKKFYYPLSKNYAVGIRFTYDQGTIPSGTGGGQFATLGYKFLT